MGGIIVLAFAIVLVIGGIVWFGYGGRKAKELDKEADEADDSSWGSSRKQLRREAERYRTYTKLGIIPIVVGALLCLPTVMYFQDPGEVIVVRNLGGSLAGSSDGAGIHAKAPWQDVVKYDVRNNTISFIGDSDEDYTGGQALGPQITINDKGGASADMDVQVQYSLKSEAALDLYAKYGTQENFVRQIVAVGTRAYSRDVAGNIDTIDILTSRGAFSESLKEALTKAWEDDGVIVENVSVQDIRYPDSIKERYAEAQAAEIAKAKAENEQKAAEVEAETKRIAAEGEANANKALQESLSEEVLMSRYIDALKEVGANGNLVVVPEGSMPMVNVQK